MQGRAQASMCSVAGGNLCVLYFAGCVVVGDGCHLSTVVPAFEDSHCPALMAVINRSLSPAL